MTDSVVHGISELLPVADVSFRYLNTDVPAQEPDLVGFSTGIMAQPRASPPQIMRSDVLQS